VSQLANLVVVGLAFGAVYALLSIGLVLIYRVSRVVNLAHGAVGVFSTYVYWYVFIDGWGLPVWLAFALTLLVGALLNAVVERLLISPVRPEGQLITLIMTIGVLLLLTDATVQIWGSNSPGIPSIFSSRVIAIGSTGVTVHQLGIAGSVILLSLLLSWVLNRTRAGLAVAAIAEDPGAARVVGLPVSRIVTLVWAAGGATAALAGMLFIHLNTLDPISLTFVLIAALVAAVIGGFTNFTRAVGASLGLGVVFSLGKGYVPVAGSANVFVFLLLLASLLLLGRRTEAATELAEF
jgi:branched-subunit amino acid ABC-type transport system permease component